MKVGSNEGGSDEAVIRYMSDRIYSIFDPGRSDRIRMMVLFDPIRRLRNRSYGGTEAKTHCQLLGATHRRTVRNLKLSSFLGEQLKAIS